MGKGLKVKNSVVVITGASSGIGRATALRFARAGARVVLAARRENALEEVADECRMHGATPLVVPVDVTDADAVEALADAAVATFGRLDVWVNCAAVTLFGALRTVPLDDVRRVLDTNVMGYVHGSRAALRVFQHQRRGVLVNVSSVVGAVPQPYTAAYSMSKAAVSSLSASIRSELLLEGLDAVNVVSILPATVDTPIFAEAANYTGRRVLAMPPVYAPQRIARAIVRSVTKPQDEIAVGSGAKAMIAQHRRAPALTERMMALNVDSSHLSRNEPAAATEGNLHRSAPDEMAAVEGGWGGRPGQARRRVLTGVALAAAIAGPIALRRASGSGSRAPKRRR